MQRDSLEMNRLFSEKNVKGQVVVWDKFRTQIIVEYSTHENVSELVKRIIAQTNGASFEETKLFYSGRRLQNDESIHEVETALKARLSSLGHLTVIFPENYQLAKPSSGCVIG